MQPDPDLLAVLLAGRPSLAEVVSVQDPDGLSRVEIRLHGMRDFPEQTATVWARVAVPFAGDGHGAFFLPDVGDEVLVAFVAGDPRWPVVLGSLWNGRAKTDERLGGSGDRVDRWTITGKAGTRIAIEEPAAGGSPKISLTTPSGVTAELTDEGGGKLTCTAAGNTLTMDTGGVKIQAAATVEVGAAQVQVTAGMVQVDAAMSKFSGVVSCDTLIATTVVATTYTPGAGNVW